MAADRSRPAYEQKMSHVVDQADHTKIVAALLSGYVGDTALVEGTPK